MTAKRFVIATIFVAVVFVGIAFAGPFSHRHAKCFGGPCGPHRTEADVSPPQLDTCHTANLSLREEPDAFSAATGHAAWAFRLTNVSNVRCQISNFPIVTLLNARGRALPFRIRNGAGGMLLAPTERPVGVIVDPGHSAFFAFEKYRCDAHETDLATTIQVRLYDSDPEPRTAAMESVSYCSAPESLTVAVSPVVTELTQLLRR